jgi:hypothetical protein
VRPTLCARPGCAGRADAWLTYDYAAQRVWLDDRPDEIDGDQWGLCEVHASRLRAPRGWSEVDRRVGRRGDYPESLVS